MMQISNGKYKTLLVNNKEDDVTEIIITKNKNDVDKSPRTFVTRPKSLKSIFLQIENNEELQHDTINLCQSNLKEQSNMAGFKHSGLRWHQFSHSPGKLLQNLFLSDRNHWIVIARGRDEVHIYDSLNSYGQGYSREASKAVCQKAYCSSATLRLINMPVQYQPNNVDCGVFAIAFATDCVFNIKPETATYKTDVMRTHLKECLTQNKFEPFPKITKRSNRCKSYITYMDVFCICCWNLSLDDSDLEKHKGLFMACCSVCEEWFHQKCVKIKREVFLDEKVHKCHLCCTDSVIHVCLTITVNM